jgi:translation initiation factor 5
MPLIQTRVEGKGNGIKTKLLNLENVSKHLRIPPQYPLRFVGAEVGANVDIKVNTVNGKFSTDDIKVILDKFIDKFILCPVCGYPETVIVVERKDLVGICSACGAHSPLDDTHKVGKYMINNPPHSKKSGGKEEEKKGKGRAGKKRGKQVEEEPAGLSPESTEI